MSFPLDIVRSAYDAFAKRDVARIFALFSPDIVIVQSEELPWGGVYRGHDGARHFFAKLTAHLNSTLEFERFITSGDHVTAIGWTCGNVIRSGAHYRVPIAHVWKVSGEVVTEVRFFIDNPTMLAVLDIPQSQNA